MMENKTDKKKVLVFPCGSEVGLEIYRSAALSTHFELIGGSSVEDHGTYVYENYIGDMPQIGDNNFVDVLNTIIDEHQIDLVFPAHDSVVLRLAQESAAGNLHCLVVTSDIATCEISRSKAKTYDHFQGILPVPRVFTKNEVTEQDLPLFLKPDVGQGSKGTQLARSIEDINFYFKKDPTLLILENLPGKEYTIDCLTDKSGALLFAEGRERIRISDGISVNSEVVADTRFRQLADKINQTLQFQGVWFFQVKENAQHEFVLMEIAPRVAGTMALSRMRGVNLALLNLFVAIGYDVSIFENHYNVSIDRALANSYKHDVVYGHVYLDLDDLVIFQERINPVVMGYVFQCINNGIKIHLLTRHKADLDQTLAKYRLSNVFDDFVWIRDETEKHTYITEKSAIFIDDSFAERKKVYDNCNIPVFDAHMIEGLMEKF